ncbi:GGDEF domain-containing protein [uncultured Desulfobacter sp.]|uniref:GGDEF domain-containing protein n=1 Tax=uncultured Desulfobacter sp. TaxID=240139 RepID=UPI0029C71664|nr:GGDEF domain-containing protein [uncultured Desulfobacter sp.]
MDYSESNTQAGEFLRLTLGFLAKHNLPATPVNYTVWYEYASGKNPKLRQAIDQMLEKKLSLNKNQVEGLYQKFISDGDRVVISRLLTKLNLMLREITMYVVETEGDLSAHGQTLDNLSDQIEDIHDFDGVKKVIDQMLDTTKAIIQSGSRLQTRMKVSSEDLKQLHKELEVSQKEARTDSLTGLTNRRGLEKRLEIERIRARQNNAPFSVIMLDIDHFKAVNDTFGHLVGDSLLKGFAALLSSQLRRNDLAARYGGEEFLILLPETNVEGAYTVSEKIRNILCKKEWTIKGSQKRIGQIKASMGIAQYKLDETGNEVITRADKAMYHAKNTGRDRIVIHSDLDLKV